MLLSSVSPATADVASAIRVMSHQLTQLESLTGGVAEEKLRSYQAWAAEASDALRSTFDLDQVEGLINTQRHDNLMARVGVEVHDQLVVNTLVRGEQRDRATAFKSIIADLERLERLVSGMPKHLALVVPDTNFFLHQGSTSTTSTGRTSAPSWTSSES